jgi:hypothetical protein
VARCCYEGWLLRVIFKEPLLYRKEVRMAKVAIVLLADMETHEALDRMANALTAATGFREAGDEPTNCLRRGGNQVGSQLAKPNSQSPEVFDSKIKSPVLTATAPRLSPSKKEVEASGIPLLEEHEGYQSLQKLISQDYRMITF